MFRRFPFAVVFTFMFAGIAGPARAATTIEDLRTEVDDLRKRVSAQQSQPTPIDHVDACACEKFGPPAPVTTRTGNLEVGGLLQIWDVTYFSQDRQDVFGDKGDHLGSGGTDRTLDNGGTQIRRAELRFRMDLNEHITSWVMIDPAREATSFAPYPSNQGLFKSQRTNPSLAHGTDVALTPVGRVQTGAGTANRMLQDAYINYHDFVPHHDFTVGQFRPAMGEEGVRNSAYLDFAERAMVTQLNDLRDLGVQAHGTWWNDRFQYWAGVFDGAGNFFGTTDPNGPLIAQPGGFQNRADDNNDKDVLGSVLVRPLWGNNRDCTCGGNWWGFLELGYSGQWGRHGGEGAADPIATPLDGLNRARTWASRQAAWLYYKPMGCLRGAWVRGEYGYQKDRTAPLTVDAFDLGSGPNGEQTAPTPFSRDGFYGAVGYKLSDSIFANRLNGGGFLNDLMQPVEFAFRYEQFGNIITESLTNPDTQTDVFKTKVVTLGVNYYYKAYNQRVQLNFSVVDEPENKTREIREVKNNVLNMTYQIMF